MDIKLWSELINKSVFALSSTLERWEVQRQKELEELKRAWERLEQGDYCAEDARVIMLDLRQKIYMQDQLSHNVRELIGSLQNTYGGE